MRGLVLVRCCWRPRLTPRPTLLARPLLAFFVLVSSLSRTPSALTLQPLPLLSILNHFTRRPTPSQTRVIGALLGRRTEAGEVVITNSFAVTHDESRVFFAESEYKGMLESMRKVSGDKENIVGWSVSAFPCCRWSAPSRAALGWLELGCRPTQEQGRPLELTPLPSLPPARYSTAPTPDVFSALIQNFFSVETAPYPAVHVTVDVSAEGNEEGLGVKGWIRCVAPPIAACCRRRRAQRPP